MSKSVKGKEKNKNKKLKKKMARKPMGKQRNCEESA